MTTDAESLTRRLEARAGEEGFAALGIAAAGRPERDAARLEDWLAHGRHAGMDWMERFVDRRGDPARLLAGCASVVIAAIDYWPGEGAAQPRPGAARVALYAQGRDYHRVLGSRLARLAAWLEAETREPARAFVDTGPVLERAWAERAGIGWIGKNANLLTRERGSWLLLGEILTAARLVPAAAPHAEFCGTCTACLDACPTGAIVADGVVDANLCISYWTIEHRGPVPEARRAGNGEWIFGCDVCQEVCPWNRGFPRQAPGGPFERREDLAGLDPEAILALDEAGFRARYSGTPLMRAKWEGMRRNACIVLANRGERRARAALERVLDDGDPVVRSHAAWALGAIGDAEARGAIERALDAEREETVREALRGALDRLGLGAASPRHGRDHRAPL